MKPQPRDMHFSDIAPDQVFSFEKLVDQKLVAAFADVSGDYNPLHTDPLYAQDTPFGDTIAHGMLLASFFSALVGMFCPGLRSLYLSQDLKFTHPLLVGERVLVQGRVVSTSPATQIVTLETIIKDSHGRVIVEGTARVKIRP